MSMLLVGLQIRPEMRSTSLEDLRVSDMLVGILKSRSLGDVECESYH